MKRKVFWTTLYIKERCYGGPEEGGWWYNNYHYVNHMFTPFGIGFNKAKTYLLKKYDGNLVVYGDFVVYGETKLKESEDETRHIYE